MKAQPSWQILECCLKKMMLIITASTSPVFWCSAPPADLGVSWLLLAPSHPFAVLCSDLVREIAAYSPSLPPLPAPHMSFKFYYCNKSALCWIFSKKKKQKNKVMGQSCHYMWENMSCVDSPLCLLNCWAESNLPTAWRPIKNVHYPCYFLMSLLGIFLRTQSCRK